MDGGLWLQARDALAGVAEFSRQKGGESIDIYCLNNPKYSLDLHVGHLSSLPRMPISLLDRPSWTSVISSTVLNQMVILPFLSSRRYLLTSQQVRHLSEPS